MPSEGDAKPRKLPQDRLAKKKRNTVKVRIALDPEVADRYETAKFEADLKRDLARNNPAARAEHDAAEAELRSARTAYEDESIEFTMQAVGMNAWDELRRQFPATDEAKKRYASYPGNTEADAESLMWDPFTFNPALIKACCKDPVLSEEDVKEIFEGGSWSTAEISALVEAAHEANITRRVVDLGKG